jgi:hypothetical protein
MCTYDIFVSQSGFGTRPTFDFILIRKSCKFGCFYAYDNYHLTTKGISYSKNYHKKWKCIKKQKISV